MSVKRIDGLNQTYEFDFILGDSKWLKLYNNWSYETIVINLQNRKVIKVTDLIKKEIFNNSDIKIANNKSESIGVYTQSLRPYNKLLLKKINGDNFTFTISGREIVLFGNLIYLNNNLYIDFYYSSDTDDSDYGTMFPILNLESVIANNSSLQFRISYSVSIDDINPKHEALNDNGYQRFINGSSSSGNNLIEYIEVFQGDTSFSLGKIPYFADSQYKLKLFVNGTLQKYGTDYNINNVGGVYIVGWVSSIFNLDMSDEIHIIYDYEEI